MSVCMSIGGFLTLGRFIVSLNVEVDEEAKVASEKQTTEDRSAFSSSASSEVGQLGPIRSREVGISLQEKESFSIVQLL